MPAPPSGKQRAHVPAHAPPRATRNRRRAFRAAVRHSSVALLLALLAADVSAQISGTASFVTNYRFRGVSLSENKPAAQFGIAYDDAQGGYAGAFASTVEFATPSGTQLQAVPFVGYAWRNATGVSWEVGADYSVFTGSAQAYDYPEVYVGAASENLSARLYYSTRYFGQNAATLYGEVNVTQPLADRVRLLAHAGILQSTNGSLYYGGPERVLDGRIGIGIDLDQFNIELSWVGINAATAAYGLIGASSHNGPVLTLLRSF
jgi:uncharacterized protein (TIGR02001 family)